MAHLFLDGMHAYMDVSAACGPGVAPETLSGVEHVHYLKAEVQTWDYDAGTNQNLYYGGNLDTVGTYVNHI